MKKFFVILGTILILVIATAIALPLIFKDDIKVMIDEELANSVNADVLFELDNFSVSLFPNFPNATVSVEELGVIGKDEFAG